MTAQAVSRSELSTAHLARLSGGASELADAYLAAARETLRALIHDPHLLEGVVLERKPRGYARTLLFGDETMSAWAIS